LVDADCQNTAYECRSAEVPDTGGGLTTFDICQLKPAVPCTTNANCNGSYCAVVPNDTADALITACFSIPGGLGRR
jgi:hypothetical protein